MPLDKPRGVALTQSGKRMRIVIPSNLTLQLKSLSRKSGVTMFITMLSAYLTLLKKYSGQDDLCVGTSVSTRSNSDLEEIIGLLANNIVLRSNLEGNPSFGELLKRTRKVAFGAFANKEIPYEKLIEELQTDRDMSHNPFFQTMLTYLVANDEVKQPFQGLTMEPITLQKKASTLELSFTITEQNDELICTMDYNTDLYNDDTIVRLLDSFVNLLKVCAVNPEIKLDDISLLSNEEEIEILENLSGRNNLINLPGESVHELFSQQAIKTPNAVAVRSTDGQYTYNELDELSNKFANFLLNNGIGSHGFVGVCMERSLEMFVVILGILKSGNAYVPIDPSYPQERKSYMVKSSKVTVLVTFDGTEFKNQENHDYFNVNICNIWNEIVLESSKLNTISTDLLYIIYTSGSTGKPKGVMVSHKSVVNHCLNIIHIFKLDPQQKVLQFTSISFDVAIQEIFPTLLSGATLVLWKDKYISGGRDFLHWVNDEKISVLNMTTAYWTNLVMELKANPSLLPANLKLIIVGGEKVSSETYLDWKKISNGKVRWINDFGLTETTITATMFEPDFDWEPLNEIPIGRPLANVEVYILDHNQKPVPIGVHGELYVGGKGLAEGYYGNPDLTKASFIKNPVITSGGSKLYKTGDKARFLPDGNIEFIGRLDSQIKIRGYRIEVGEIEAAIKQIESISEAIVIAFQQKNGSTQLLGYIVVNNDDFEVDSLSAALKKKLPNYMIPLHFIKIENVPLTINGKVDEERLPKPKLDELRVNSYILPRTTTEKLAAGIWESILESTSIGISDNFFEIGGNSLLATQIIYRANNIFGINVPLKSLFEYPILEDWAKEIDRVKINSLKSHQVKRFEKSIVRIQSKGNNTPIFFVHPVGGTVSCYFSLAHNLGIEQPFYAFQDYGFVNEGFELDSIDSMVEHYIKEIFEIQPAGPYRIGGWSMGGFIAYEIAKRLKESGYEVSQLIIIDSYLSKKVNRNNDSIVYNFIKQLSELSDRKIDDSLIKNLINLRDLDLYQELINVGIVPQGTSIEDITRLFVVYKRTANAFHNYNPSQNDKLDIPNTLLFRADDSPENEGIWQRLVKNLSLKNLNANHFTIVHSPLIGAIVNEEYTARK